VERLGKRLAESARLSSAPSAIPSVTARTTSRMLYRSKRPLVSASNVMSRIRARMSTPSRTDSLAAFLMSSVGGFGSATSNAGSVSAEEGRGIRGRKPWQVLGPEE
jgi:hypothetical protein